MSLSLTVAGTELSMPDADNSESLDHPARSRPTIIRRETSQILSYYQSADAGRSDLEDLYAYAYRSSSGAPGTSNASPRSASPSSRYSSTSDTGSVSDYGAAEGDGDANMQYGIAMGSPGLETLMNTASGTDADGNRDGTDVGTGYGSRIIRQGDAALSGSRASPTHLPLPPFELTLPPTQQKQQEQEQWHEQSAVAPAPVPTVDPIPFPRGEAEGAAPGRRRRVSSRGASDKRRVAIVQMDSETDGSEQEAERETERERRAATATLSDGFGRVEAPRMRLPGHALAQGQFSVPSSSSPSAFPFIENAYSSPNSSSTAASALLVRRGIVGTFALVAPPDASPSAYTNLSYFTPPLSAPAVAHPTPPLLARNESAASTSTNTASSSSSRHQHQRSQSEAVLTSTRSAAIHTISNANSDSRSSSSKADRRRPGHRLKKSSRDIGIVGTTTAISPTSGTMKMDVQLRLDETKARTATEPDADPAHTGQLSPIFQTPSRSQTSLLSSEDASSPGTGEPHAQSSSASKEAKRRSQQPPPNGNGTRSGTGNGTTPRSPRDENISPVVVGIDPKQMWHAPSLSSAAHTSYAASSGLQSLSHYSMTTSPSVSPPPRVGVHSPYLYYQPGVHATAGPLPSPPRQIFPPARDSPPPPRPPRLHAPSSGSSSLAKRKSETSINSKQEQAPSPVVRNPEVTSPAMTPSTTSSTLVNSQSEDSVKNKGHTREGAFPITSVIVTEATPTRPSVKQEQQEQKALKRKNTMDDLVKDVTAAIDEAAALTHNTSPASPSNDTRPPMQNQNEPPEEHTLSGGRSGVDLRREESRSTFKGGEPLSRSASSDYSNDDYDNAGDITVTKPPSPLPSPRTDSQDTSSKPQKMFDLALKRFSALPRPPSRLSVTRASPRSSLSHERHSQERFSHEHERAPARPKVAKIRSAWPDAMQFGDVTARKSPLERSLGYARKINELANHDPGLGDWVVSTKHNLTVPGNSTKRKSMSPVAVRSPSERSVTFQTRHPSRGSISSEMTFPKRVDAYVATDLLQKPSEDPMLPQGPPPTLPYPTLALGSPAQQPARLGAGSSMRSIPSSLGSNKSTGGGGGGFFASIGRKTSVKKDRPAVQGATSAPPNKLLSKRQQAVPAPAPRPVQISASPSLPGGPRAPPGRVQRAQSVIAPKTTAPGYAAGGSETDMAQQRSIKRSPSVAPSLARNASSLGAEASSNVDAQVGKLADLLPHADTTILAGYLRRAGGQEMMAIGRYLDDEKNGTLLRE